MFQFNEEQQQAGGSLEDHLIPTAEQMDQQNLNSSPTDQSSVAYISTQHLRIPEFRFDKYLQVKDDGKLYCLRKTNTKKEYICDQPVDKWDNNLDFGCFENMEEGDIKEMTPKFYNKMALLTYIYFPMLRSEPLVFLTQPLKMVCREREKNNKVYLDADLIGPTGNAMSLFSGYYIFPRVATATMQVLTKDNIPIDLRRFNVIMKDHSPNHFDLENFIAFTNNSSKKTSSVPHYWYSDPESRDVMAIVKFEYIRQSGEAFRLYANLMGMFEY